MKAILDTLVGRAILVILGGIVIVQLSSQWIYESTLSSEVALANQERLAERIASLYQAVGLVPQERRDSAAHDLSGGAVEAHWARQPRAGAALDGDWATLRQQLQERLTEAGPDGIMVGTDSLAANSAFHLSIISLRLPDQTWINIGILAPHFHPPRSWLAILSTTAVALVVLLISIVFVRWLTRPLERFAEAAHSFHLAASESLVPEAGPREIRTLAAAFNEMQLRIRRQIRARTQALAAVSHDLKTPLTRLRLRMEDVTDADFRRAVEQDLDEMDRMIEATLNYLRGDRAGEEIQSVEIAVLVGSIADEASDMGQDVKLDAPPRLVVRGRRLALKRALTNLVQNAIKYGGSAEIVLVADGSHATITVSDRGPGIPEGSIPALFEPFARLDSSRNSDTGGFGLGLTIAQDIVRAHDGSLNLSNREGGGLTATVILPLGGPRRNIL